MGTLRKQTARQMTETSRPLVWLKYKDLAVKSLKKQPETSAYMTAMVAAAMVVANNPVPPETQGKMLAFGMLTSLAAAVRDKFKQSKLERLATTAIAAASTIAAGVASVSQSPKEVLFALAASVCAATAYYPIKNILNKKITPLQKAGLIASGSAFVGGVVAFITSAFIFSNVPAIITTGALIIAGKIGYDKINARIDIQECERVKFERTANIDTRGIQN